MLNTILDAIYQAYLEEDFKEQFGISLSLDFENSNLELLDYLSDSNAQVTVKMKKEDTESEKKWHVDDIIGIATAHGEEVGFKNGFLIGLVFGNQVNSKPINLKL